MKHTTPNATPAPNPAETFKARVLAALDHALARYGPDPVCIGAAQRHLERKRARYTRRRRFARRAVQA